MTVYQHVIAEPPEKSSAETDDEYAQRVADWYRLVSYWATTWKPQ